MPTPFDPAAATYDADFTRGRLGRWLRGRVQRHLEEAFDPGDHALEIGCGTGEDAVWLGHRGVRVTALDASRAMVDLARAKVAAAGLEERVAVARCDVSDPVAFSAAVGSATFDGAFSDFGPLNCIRDRHRLARSLARRVRPGGRLVLVVMGPFCPWETAGHLLRGRVGTALRRLHASTLARLGPGSEVRVDYPSPRRLAGEMAPWFRPLETRGLGTLLPPTDFRHLVERFPRLFAVAADADRLAGHLPGAAWASDHFIAIFEREGRG